MDQLANGDVLEIGIIELDRAALVEQFIQNPTMTSEVTLICRNLDRQTERGRSEFHGEKQ